MKRSDQDYMRRAIQLAKKAWGMTSPNPIVGAVIVKNDEIIGEGWHHCAGQPHAEIEAIQSLPSFYSAKNATIYVTLEPCCSAGRTPPCCDALIAAGFSRVVIGCMDPNPKHSGQGIEILKTAGIQVTTGVCEETCRDLNKSFFKWITSKKPYVLLKIAQTLDGRIATASGSSKWITGDSLARKRVAALRIWSDAVMIGANTYRMDNPRLTARDKNDKVIKMPKRFVLTNHPDVLNLSSGWYSISLQSGKDWDSFLSDLGSQNILSLLLEGGGELAASALNAGIVDEIEFHIAPKLLGGKNSRPAVGGNDPLSISEAYPLENFTFKKLGKNIQVNAIPMSRGYIGGV